MFLLFPGRHLLTTRFQERYLADLLGQSATPGTLSEVLFAITSANQANSRYNPLPLEFRAVAIDRFARDILAPRGIRWRILPIPHYAPSPRFAEFLLKEIAQSTEGELTLTPDNTLLLSSTPELLAQFTALHFPVVTAELATVNPPHFTASTPIEVLQRAALSPDPLADPQLLPELSASTLSMWRDFPDVLRRLQRLYRDPILTQQGSLTEMRNYSTYAQGMNHRALLELKYQDIQPAVLPGRIVDEGCADGALLVPIARDFPDSDLIGIEITGEFLARCHERQRALEYAGSFIHFHQRNLMESVFLPNSIDTTICNSTTHELWSYGKQEPTLRNYLAEKFRQLRPGGRLIIRDVVGPEDHEQPVLLWCNDQDGANENIHRPCSTPEGLTTHLSALSTAARFQRFAEDFLADLRASGRRSPDTKIHFETRQQAGRTLFHLSLRDAMEFLLKKDYADNWRSELNEEFCFWSFTEWQQALRDAGFQILEGATLSRPYASPWIIQNRFETKAQLLHPQTLAPLPWPATNMVLVGQK